MAHFPYIDTMQQNPLALHVICSWCYSPQWPCLFYEESVHSGHYGHHMGIHWNVAYVSIEIQIICNLFWTLEVNCHWILVTAQYCFLIKKSGYPRGCKRVSGATRTQTKGSIPIISLFITLWKCKLKPSWPVQKSMPIFKWCRPVNILPTPHLANLLF